MRLWIYAVRRGLLLVPALVGVITVLFVIQAQLPTTFQLDYRLGQPSGGWQPTTVCPTGGGSYLCPNPQYYSALHQIGLDQSYIVQWAVYVGDVLTLNWGIAYLGCRSFSCPAAQGPEQYPVSEVVARYLPYTLELTLLAFLGIFVVGLPVAKFLAARRSQPVEAAARTAGLLGYAFPVFLLATLLLFGAIGLSGGARLLTCNQTTSLYFAWVGSWPQPGCLPNGAYPSFIGSHFQTSPTGVPTLDALLSGEWALTLNSIGRMVLPALIVAALGVAFLWTSRRIYLRRVAGSDHLRFARATGLPENEITRRKGGRHALAISLAVVGPTFIWLVPAIIVVELVFQLEGLGVMLVRSVEGYSPDFGMLFGIALAFAMAGIVVTFLGDVAAAWIDPRLRIGSALPARETYSPPPYYLPLPEAELALPPSRATSTGGRPSPIEERAP